MPAMQNRGVEAEIMQMRSQGLPDHIIFGEMTKKGYPPDQVHLALAQMEGPVEESPSVPSAGYQQEEASQGAIYGRIEEIAEGIIDEKWDELLAEVKKIVEWKERMEEKQAAIASDVEKLQGDFKVLHQGVLGRLQEYDGRMQEVGVELKAVGKVFKDVIPQFVENVKELGGITKGMKQAK